MTQHDHTPSRRFDEIDALHVYLDHLKQQLEVALCDLADMRERQRLADLKAEEQS